MALSKAVEKALAENDMEALALAMPARKRRFSEEYAIDYNATAAAIRAGYARKWADRQGSALVKDRGVYAYIEHLTRSQAAKISAVNPDYIVTQVTDIISKPGAKDGDRLRGLELLARYLGMFIDRTELTGKDGGPLEVEQRKVEEEAASFKGILDSLRKTTPRLDDSENVVPIKRKA